MGQLRILRTDGSFAMGPCAILKLAKCIRNVENLVGDFEPLIILRMKSCK